jgi:hypothetical protein
MQDYGASPRQAAQRNAITVLVRKFKKRSRLSEQRFATWNLGWTAEECAYTCQSNLRK